MGTGVTERENECLEVEKLQGAKPHRGEARQEEKRAASLVSNFPALVCLRLRISPSLPFSLNFHPDSRSLSGAPIALHL